MQHVALVLPSLQGGGAERLTIDLAREFRARGARVDIVLLRCEGAFLSVVPEGVSVVDLGVTRLRSAVLPLRRYFLREKPDAVLAAMWPLTAVTVLAATGLSRRPRIVVSDHAPLERQYGKSRKGRLILKATMRATYPVADAVVAVSNGLAGELARLAGLPRQRVAAIHNPIPKPSRSPGFHADWGGLPGKRILSVGSFKPVKNFPLLLRAFAPLAHASEAVLAIVGTGPEQAALTALASELGIADRLILPGFTTTPGDWYDTADVFVLASDHEGFGNVLVEALHHGLPIVATDCPYGPREILDGERWGALVPTGDEQAITAALRQAMAAKADRKPLVARAGQFSLRRAADQYWALLNGYRG